MKANPNFTVTLLVSTYNRPEALEPVLLSVLRQTFLPTEVVIADDGSKDETRQLIKRIQAISQVPIVHVWHPDDGFRLSVIRNKAIAAAKGDYIIQIDGDVLLDRHFIADHLDVAERGWFVCGSRVYLDSQLTEKVLRNGWRAYYKWTVGLNCILNGLRNKLLRRYLAKRYGQANLTRLRGCNMAFWKTDLVAINGYNEDIINWGGEDAEIAYRLRFKGIQKKALKMGGVIFHLHHKFEPRNSNDEHDQIIAEIKAQQSSWCDNGLDKHLNQK